MTTTDYILALCGSALVGAIGKSILDSVINYLLPIIERFKKYLPFEGKNIDRRYIKVNEL